MRREAMMRAAREESVDSRRRRGLEANDVDECRIRAMECGRNAVKVRDDLLSEAYFQLAHHWRVIGEQSVPTSGEKE